MLGGPSTQLIELRSLTALLRTSVLGIAICDRQLRFESVNEALASMNGVPARAQIGKTPYQILGDVAARVEPAFHHVFATGKPVLNREVSGKLSTRAEVGHWVDNVYPIKDKSGKVLKVGAVVLEITKNKSIERTLHHLRWKLLQAVDSLKYMDIAPRTKEPEPQAKPLELLENCIMETRMLAELIRSAPYSPFAANGHAVSHNSAGNSLGLASAARTCDLRADRLSPREREVVQLLAEGKSNKNIAGLLQISIRTVETHRARSLLKLHLHSTADLVRYAVRNRLV
jgi:DNA-binding CsgD family transcriptional regulator